MHIHSIFFLIESLFLAGLKEILLGCLLHLKDGSFGCQEGPFGRTQAWGEAPSGSQLDWSTVQPAPLPTPPALAGRGLASHLPDCIAVQHGYLFST